MVMSIEVAENVQGPFSANQQAGPINERGRMGRVRSGRLASQGREVDAHES
jgi:hypothetical protein